MAGADSVKKALRDGLARPYGAGWIHDRKAKFPGDAGEPEVFPSMWREKKRDPSVLKFPGSQTCLLDLLSNGLFRSQGKGTVMHPVDADLEGFHGP